MNKKLIKALKKQTEAVLKQSQIDKKRFQEHIAKIDTDIVTANLILKGCKGE